MLLHAAYLQTWQVFFQFGIGHVSVLRNERKRKISGHPDDILASWKSTQDSSQAIQRVQCQHGPLLLRVCDLGGFKGLSRGLRDGRSTALPRVPTPMYPSQGRCWHRGWPQLMRWWHLQWPRSSWLVLRWRTLAAAAGSAARPHTKSADHL